ncbi:hypothetical protein P0R31_36940 [Bradyrhizobium yuanmingense]|uniref:hypothetical protein n=1 Tax=Bradyrhizobium yuanmingense TaxID=108015 RepID=UPI0023B9D273|nr:hypothetical protein [Bradyrhizobium yuanmingense]MDF0522825.1 hypothetical protein [Bradyrhizobium yuanmingense]
MKNKPISARLSTLDGLTRTCAKALKEIIVVMAEADRARLGAIYGGIGFFSGAAAAWVGCSGLSLAETPAIVSAAAAACGLTGLRLSYSKADIALKKRKALIGEAIDMRNDEVRHLDDRIKKSRLGRSSDLPFLEYKRTALLLASNEQLLLWAGLAGPRDVNVEPLQLAPPQERLLLALPAPAALQPGIPLPALKGAPATVGASRG